MNDMLALRLHSFGAKVLTPTRETTRVKGALCA